GAADRHRCPPEAARAGADRAGSDVLAHDTRAHGRRGHVLVRHDRAAPGRRRVRPGPSRRGAGVTAARGRRHRSRLRGGARPRHVRRGRVRAARDGHRSRRRVDHRRIHPPWRPGPDHPRHHRRPRNRSLAMSGRRRAARLPRRGLDAAADRRRLRRHAGRPVGAARRGSDRAVRRREPDRLHRHRTAHARLRPRARGSGTGAGDRPVRERCRRPVAGAHRRRRRGAGVRVAASRHPGPRRPQRRTRAYAAGLRAAQQAGPAGGVPVRHRAGGARSAIGRAVPGRGSGRERRGDSEL
ncbi:MAG: hypothetical protein AVDCRST_MAG69-628, partial [uncultured Solirubrobacteraceae bacterium]